MKASQWIDKVKAARGWDSDYRVAKELGFKANTISMYRAHGGPMDEAIALKVAQSLGIDPALVLADQAMERAKDAEARGAWSSILQRLGGVAAGVLVTVGLSSAPAPANAAAAGLLHTVPGSVYYVKLDDDEAPPPMPKGMRGKKLRNAIQRITLALTAPSQLVSA